MELTTLIKALIIEELLVAMLMGNLLLFYIASALPKTAPQFNLFGMEVFPRPDGNARRLIVPLNSAIFSAVFYLWASPSEPVEYYGFVVFINFSVATVGYQYLVRPFTKGQAKPPK